MVALIFDTETTGLPIASHPRNHPQQPDIIQIAGMLADEDNVFGQFNFIVRTEQDIHPKAQEAHGITKEVIAKFGIPRRSALNIFHHLLKTADEVVCHNTKFDLLLVEIMYARENVEIPKFPPSYCTMMNGVQVCKIPSPKRPGTFKWPTLQEAFRVLVDPKGFEGAHNAMVDVAACYEIYKKLKQHERAA